MTTKETQVADDAPKSRRQKELEATRKLLSQANGILEEVDESFIMKKGARQYPTFSSSEIVRGPLLGVGGFGIVYEVKEFRLKIPNELELPMPITPNSAEGENTAEKAVHSVRWSEEETASTSVTQQIESQANLPTTEATQDGEDDEDKNLNDIMMELAPDDTHYDVKDARYMMARHARRQGSSRYAIKKLHSDLNDLERARGMIDMALEAKYLSVMWHPNIGMYLHRKNHDSTALLGSQL